MARFSHNIVLLALLLAVSGPAQAAPLKVGTPAPAIALKDQDNKAWALADTLQRPEVKAVLLYFYPKDNTPGCTKQACALRDRAGTLMQKGVEIVGINFDNTASHQRFIKKYALNFTLLSDLKGAAADAYGVRIPNRNLTRRVSFLISGEGKILHVFDHRDAIRHVAEMQMAIDKHLP